MAVPPPSALTTGPVCGFIANDYDLFLTGMITMLWMCFIPVALWLPYFNTACVPPRLRGLKGFVARKDLKADGLALSQW